MTVTQHDLRSFIRQLETHDKLLTLARPVSPARHMGALILEAQKLGKAVLFESVTGTDMRCAGNLVGSRELMALALGVDAPSLINHFLDRLGEGIKPVLVEDAPVQEYVHKIDDFPLHDLPIVTYSEKDAAPYVTAGLVVAQYPGTDRRNVSYHRMMLRGPNELGVRLTPKQDLDRIHEQNEQQGRGTEVAVALGNHPAELIAGGTSLPYGMDEFELAGALRGEPLEVARCRTVDVEVPAHCEIILEGEVLSGVREPEGPFGDFMEFYIPPMDNHVLRINAITYRSNPIYQAMHAGAAEDMGLLALPREAQLSSALKEVGTQVHDVSYSPTVFGAVVSIEKRFAGEAKQVLSVAFGRHRWLKFCVVVDHDVDVLDMEDVWWALVTRSRYGSGVLQIDHAAGFPRDAHGLHKSKLGIDATIPFGTWEAHERKRAPGYGQLRLQDFMND